ncbi:MAG: M1 family aminopeptidase [Ferruginibacter sp.]
MKNLNFLIALLFVCNIAGAQNANRSAHNRMVSSEIARYGRITNLATASTGLDYDVKYYRLELRLNPDTSVGKYVRGKVTTYLTNLTANFNLIKFDLAAVLSCDSVYYHGAKLAAGKVVENGDVLEITIPSIAATGTLDSVSVYYKGAPPAIPDLGGQLGFLNLQHGSGPSRSNYIYTISESYGAYTWWPCKSAISSDKADSLDLIFSTPTGFKAAGNGVLVSETTSGSNVITYWKHRHPISSYQVCVAVANYVQYPTTPTLVNISGTMMPYYNWLFPETNSATAKTNLDKVPTMITTFSSKFGDYPFKDEKYGQYTFGLGGGMEHNTFTGIDAGSYNTTNAWDVIAHELGHQWFGASVTCGSWGDIWVNESFATYSEIVCAEFAPAVSGTATGLSWRQGMKTKVMSSSYQARAVYVTDTSSTSAIFSPSVYIYDRGAMVLSMLRSLLGDANFFQALKNYQADNVLKYSTSLTADVQRHMENVSGIDLSNFFAQWIYQKGVASYANAKWNNIGQQIILQLPQTVLYNASLTHFDMPVAVRIKGAVAGQDTTIIAYDKNGILYYDINGTLINSGASMIQYQLSFVPTTVLFDDYSQVLANGSFTKDGSLSALAVNIVKFTGKKAGADALLNWEVDNTLDKAVFEIEKSEDGRAFGKIGQLNAGDFLNQYRFSYTDPNIKQGVLYYRIKIIPQAGAVLYTKTISISSEYSENDFTIAPNPAKDFIDISASSVIDKTVSIKLFDVAGRLIKTAANLSFGTGRTVRINLDDVNPGNYFVEINSNSGKISKRIVVVK